MSKGSYDWWLQQIEGDPVMFRTGGFGLEKENLRILEDGTLDHSDHPISAEDPFYHQIVKDFSESQMEFVTKPKGTPIEALEELRTIQNHVLESYDVRLWPFSMPCRLEAPEKIRIAAFPPTEEGKAAEAYRQLLAEKHGKKMQLISGVHYNFSFGKAIVKKYSELMVHEDGLSCGGIKSLLYFHVARNLLRHQWLLTYLYGASPSVDATYKEEVLHNLEKNDSVCDCPYSDHTYFETYGTSLRMSRYGYHSELQRGMEISYNCLDDYIGLIRKGIDSGILQKESEYYSPVRFKHSEGKPGEMLRTLEQEGVEYLELRLFDLNPFDFYNITEDQVYFTHLFMIYSMMMDSPEMTSEEMDQLYLTDQYAALRGRESEMAIEFEGTEDTITNHGKIVLRRLWPIAERLDSGLENTPYIKSLKEAGKRLEEPKCLISARLHEELIAEGISFIRQGLNLSMTKEGREEKIYDNGCVQKS